MNVPLLRSQIAQIAASLIAQGEEKYSVALKKAVCKVLLQNYGQKYQSELGRKDLYPDKAAVNEALLLYLRSQDAGYANRLRFYRVLALKLMQQWSFFNPYLTGAAWNGLVTSSSCINLEFFYDPPKEVMMQLMGQPCVVKPITVLCSQQLRFSQKRSKKRLYVEAVTFEAECVPVIAALYPEDVLREKSFGISKSIPYRGSISAVVSLLQDESVF